MQLVAELSACRDETITIHQALLQFGVDLRRWSPALGLEPRAELRERLGINGIGLGAFEQRFGEIVRHPEGTRRD